MSAAPMVLDWERVPFLRALPALHRDNLLPAGRLKTVEPGHPCWTEGESPSDFAFVVRGRVKLGKAAESGRETILEIAGPGDLLCGTVVFGFTPHCCSALALERPTEILLLPRKVVLELVERSPTAARAFMRELSDRGQAMCRRVEELGGGQVEQRIALLLLKLADRGGIVEKGGAIRVPFRLTRRDLAALCGTTVETAIRVMSRLNKRKIVSASAAGFLVLDRPALQGIARARLPIARGDRGCANQCLQPSTALAPATSEPDPTSSSMGSRPASSRQR
jgi:CRP-like cAMP-binding protein